MIPNRKRFRQSFLLVLPMILVALDLQGQSHAKRTVLPQRFDFEVRLRSLAARNETRILRRGALLYPMAPGSKVIYQPIVLCDNLKLQFDEQGVSQKVRVRGFCFALGRKAADPPENFDWAVTAIVAPAVAAAGTCEGVWREKPGEPAIAGWQGEIPAFSIPCRKKFSECYDDFSSEAEDQYHIPMEEILKNQVCAITDTIEKGRRVGYRLECYR